MRGEGGGLGEEGYRERGCERWRGKWPGRGGVQSEGVRGEEGGGVGEEGYRVRV